MEEKKNKSGKFGFPMWMKIVYFVVAVGTIVVTSYRFNADKLSIFGLIVGMICLFCLCDCFRITEEQSIADYYEDEIDSLNEKISNLEKENKKINKKSTKTKKQ